MAQATYVHEGVTNQASLTNVVQTRGEFEFKKNQQTATNRKKQQRHMSMENSMPTSRKMKKPR